MQLSECLKFVSETIDILNISDLILRLHILCVFYKSYLPYNVKMASVSAIATERTKNLSKYLLIICRTL